MDRVMARIHKAKGQKKAELDYEAEMEERADTEAYHDSHVSTESDTKGREDEYEMDPEARAAAVKVLVRAKALSKGRKLKDK